jgi:deazaflavin-dependent oxidoreductase (nitroreductase family)
VIRVDSPIGRAVQRLARARAFAPVASRLVPRIDRGLASLSNGRVTLSQLLVPTLVLTATGARSGRLRSTPLLTLPEPDGSLLVVASNFGRPSDPAWSANLLAHPAASVVFRGSSFPVRAQLLDAAQKAQVWPRLLSAWPTYAQYAQMSGRDLPVFRLART